MSTTLPKDAFNEWYKSLIEVIPVEIKTGGKEDLDPRNWDKPSKAVVASDGCGNGCIIFSRGPHIYEEIDAVGRKLSDLGLDDCPEGIWIWEGFYRTITHNSPDYGTDYSTEANGKFLIPTAAEWSCIRTNVCPWDEKEWFKDYVSDTDFLRMSIEEEKKKDREFVFDLAKQEDKTIMAKYDLCNEQNVAALQKQEFVTSTGRNQGKTKELMESVERLAKLSKDTNLPIWTASQKQNICTRCGLAIDALAAFVGDGDGRGHRYAHYDCFFPPVKMCTQCNKNPVGKYLNWADCCKQCFDKTMNAGNEKPVEIMTGDCIAQCLNCVWNGWEGYTCTCGSTMMSMDSDRIRKEKENGEAGRRTKMKCSGCRAGLPLGSGRYHYDTGDITIPCTHNPVTGMAYDQSTGVAQTRKLKTKWSIIDVQPMPPGANLIFDDPEIKIKSEPVNQSCKKCGSLPHKIGVVHCPKCNLLFDRIENKHTMNYKDVSCDFSFNRSVEHIKVDIQINSPRCECGGEKASTTHSDWCPKGGTK